LGNPKNALFAPRSPLPAPRSSLSKLTYFILLESAVSYSIHVPKSGNSI
jgi:hypothetical protein